MLLVRGKREAKPEHVPGLHKVHTQLIIRLNKNCPAIRLQISEQENLQIHRL